MKTIMLLRLVTCAVAQDGEDGRLLYLGAMAQIMVRRRLTCGPGSDWLSNMLMRKKAKVVAIALAHRMARTIFAVLRDGTRYKPQATAA